MIKNMLKYAVKGLIYSAVFAVIGGAFSLFKGWELLKGAYMSVLGAGLLTMAISIILLVGTPQMRKEDLAREKKTKHEERMRGGEGIAPASMGLVMIIIGLALEALMH